MRTEWDDARFRAIDDSVATPLRQMLVAVTGMFVAFLVEPGDRRSLHRARRWADFVAEGALFAGSAALPSS